MAINHKFDISVVGELNLDLILYGLPEKLELDREHLAEELQLTLGSSSAILAHNVALLGNRVGFHSAIGDDPLGELCLARLAESGTDVTGVRRFPGRQTGLTVILPRGSQRYILTYLGAMADLCFEDLDLKSVFSSRHLHLSSYFLQRGLRPRVGELFRMAKKSGLTTSLDTNDDPDDVWEKDALEVLRWVDVLFPNEREACRLARLDNPVQAMEFLAETVPLVVMKRGERGVMARRGGEVFEALPPRVEAVDSVGAGDSFDAGFLHKYIRGARIEECLRMGNLAGALSTTRSGGTEAFRDREWRTSFFSAREVGEEC
jgi:sugar/nucleoside kinase (ribokinase family)